MKTKSALPKISIENVIFLLLTSLLSTFLGLVLPFSILIIFDRVVPNAATSSLWILFLIIISSIILDYFLKQREGKLLSSIVKTFEHKLSTDIYKSLCGANISKFNQFSTGEYLERINAIGQIKDFFGGEWIKSTINIITCAITIFVISIIDLWSGISLLIASTVIFLIALNLSNKKNAMLKKKSDTEGKTSSKIIEIVSNPINLKSGAMEYRMENMMDSLVRDREKYATEFEKLESSFSLKINFVQQISISMILIHCGLSVISLELSQGVMAAVILLTNRYFSPLQQVMFTMSRWKINWVYLQRVMEVLNLSDDKIDAHSIPNIKDISICNSRYNFYKGEIAILQGPSGSGKSFSTKAIALECERNGIDIQVNGDDIDNIDYMEWRNRIIRVDKSSGFVEGTIIDNITCFKPEHYKAAYSLSSALGIKQTIDELRMGFYTEMKGNQSYPFSRQVAFSLAIIRALLSQKDMIVIDDIDIVYDQKFGLNLINCLLPRVDSIVCVFISNKMDFNSKNVRSISFDIRDKLNV